VESLDPRVTRLPEINVRALDPESSVRDQFATFEVFVQPKAGKPFQHEGSIHAPNLEMAYILAKETLTRRFTCSSLCVVATIDVVVSPLTEGSQSIYDTLGKPTVTSGKNTSFEIYHLTKRGKQHIYFRTIEATSPLEAMLAAKEQIPNDLMIYNIWVIPTEKIRFTSTDDLDLWSTLPDKKFRDASDYRGGEKLKQAIEKSKP
jgi:ring-1,2-phenylacetyl-CoA epoxidase subunit PaaB